MSTDNETWRRKDGIRTEGDLQNTPSSDAQPLAQAETFEGEIAKNTDVSMPPPEQPGSSVLTRVFGSVRGMGKWVQDRSTPLLVTAGISAVVIPTGIRQYHDTTTHNRRVAADQAEYPTPQDIQELRLSLQKATDTGEQLDRLALKYGLTQQGAFSNYDLGLVSDPVLKINKLLDVFEKRGKNISNLDSGDRITLGNAMKKLLDQAPEKLGRLHRDVNEFVDDPGDRDRALELIYVLKKRVERLKPTAMEVIRKEFHAHPGPVFNQEHFDKMERYYEEHRKKFQARILKGEEGYKLFKNVKDPEQIINILNTFVIPRLDKVSEGYYMADRIKKDVIPPLQEAADTKAKGRNDYGPDLNIALEGLDHVLNAWRENDNSLRVWPHVNDVEFLRTGPLRNWAREETREQRAAELKEQEGKLDNALTVRVAIECLSTITGNMGMHADREWQAERAAVERRQ